jgi:hypothetical protein
MYWYFLCSFSHLVTFRPVQHFPLLSDILFILEGVYVGGMCVRVGCMGVCVCVFRQKSINLLVFEKLKCKRVSNKRKGLCLKISCCCCELFIIQKKWRELRGLMRGTYYSRREILPYIRRLKGQFQKSKVRETVRRSGHCEEEEGEAGGGQDVALSPTFISDVAHWMNWHSVKKCHTTGRGGVEKRDKMSHRDKMSQSEKWSGVKQKGKMSQRGHFVTIQVKIVILPQRRHVHPLGRVDV